MNSSSGVFFVVSIHFSIKTSKLSSSKFDEDIDDFFYGFNGDWETRRIFTSFEYKKVNTPNTTYSVKFIQAGIAPYLGEYGDLHTWLMVKLKKNSLSDSWSAFPFFKFFKGEALLEFGYNKTDWEAHFMYRF